MNRKRFEEELTDTVTLGDSVEAKIQKAIAAVQEEPRIPREAKDAVLEFLIEHKDALIDHIESLADFQVPEQIQEWWPIIVEILKSVGLG